MDLDTRAGSDRLLRPRRHLVVLLLLLAAGVVLIDQATKAVALQYLGGGRSVELVGEFLQLRLLYNPGAAFSLATGMTWVLTVIAVVVVAVVVRVARRLGSRGWAVALGLLLGGAVGNLIDRLTRAPGFGRGHVIDFIAYWDWFVGNVADIAIVAAAALIVLLGLLGIGVDGSREPRPHSGDHGGHDA
ncbi:MAG: signal peptidase II [Actinomycetota bacterium]